MSYRALVDKTIRTSAAVDSAHGSTGIMKKPRHPNATHRIVVLSGRSVNKTNHRLATASARPAPDPNAKPLGW